MRQETSALLLGLALAACGAQTHNLAVTEAKSEPAPSVHAATPAPAETEPAAAKDEQRVDLSHAVGDYIVRRFSLKSRANPTIITERVIAVKDKSYVLEVTRESGSESRSIRVEMGSEPANRGEVLSVVALRGGKEFAMGRAAYQAIMRDTIFTTDENEGAIDSAKVKLDVQGHALDGTETRFRVKVRGKAGTMRTIELENSPWGEVGGEVTAADGSVLYRAEVVDVGREELRTAAVQDN
jgi:hypothetical protein